MATSVVRADTTGAGRTGRKGTTMDGMPQAAFIDDHGPFCSLCGTPSWPEGDGFCFEHSTEWPE